MSGSVAALTTLLTIALCQCASAQSVATMSSGVRGVVLDRDSGQPVDGVLITVVGDPKYATTDSKGAFNLDVKPKSGDGVTLLLQRLGYEDRSLTIEAPLDTALVLELAPKPLVLEGLTVVVDRLERRRKALPYLVRTLSGGRLLETNVADTYALVGTRLLNFVRCPGDRGGLLRCYRYQGRTIRPHVFVDDTRLWGDEWVETLRSLRPADVATVEVIPSPMAGQIRVYTKRFMELVATHPGLLAPVIVIR